MSHIITPYYQYVPNQLSPTYSFNSFLRVVKFTIIKSNYVECSSTNAKVATGKQTFGNRKMDKQIAFRH